MCALDLDSYLRSWRSRINRRLAGLMERMASTPGCPAGLSGAMRHALLGPGKRLRPLLTLAGARACGGEEASGISAACAVELVHAYSLAHDDLPAMDDDDFRRGRPTCHREYGEALAILAGDALLTHAFGLLAGAVPADRAGEAVRMLAEAAGAAGMVGGQADDVEPNEDEAIRVELVESIHLRKTGLLIEAAVRLGGLVAGASGDALGALGRYGRSVGLAFQIADDLLAHAGDSESLGRPTFSDADQGRRTHPRAVGPEASRERAAGLVASALSAVERFGDRADVLVGLARLVAGRAGVDHNPNSG